MTDKTTFGVNKLIRTKRYENREERGRTISSTCLASRKKELIIALHHKGQEEIAEVKKILPKNDRNAILGETADVQQVVKDLETLLKEKAENDKELQSCKTFIAQICERCSIELSEVLAVQEHKEETDGGYIEWHLVQYVTIPEEDERHEYFKNNYESVKTAL